MKLEPKFKIYKEGVTEKTVTILGDESFNESFKREKYTTLGYNVIELN